MAAAIVTIMALLSVEVMRVQSAKNSEEARRYRCKGTKRVECDVLLNSLHKSVRRVGNPGGLPTARVLARVLQRNTLADGASATIGTDIGRQPSLNAVPSAAALTSLPA